MDMIVFIICGIIAGVIGGGLIWYFISRIISNFSGSDKNAHWLFFVIPLFIIAFLVTVALYKVDRNSLYHQIHDTQTTTSTKQTHPVKWSGDNQCMECGGTGYLQMHYGNRLNHQEGYGYGDVCHRCHGTGYYNFQTGSNIPYQ